MHLHTASRRVLTAALISGVLLHCGSHEPNDSATSARLSTTADVSVGVFFGNVQVGQTATLSIGVSNSGGATLTLSGASLSGPGLSVTGPALPVNLAPGASIEVGLAFAPASPGAVEGALSLTSNAPGSPVQVPVSGTGVSSGSDAGASSAFSMLVSTSSSRSPARALAGAAVSGLAYIFTSDATGTANPSGITQVQYWLDDPSMSGTPTHTEKVVPYDFGGTAGDGSAQAWDTSTVSPGTHTLTQSVTAASGAVQNLTASFTVAQTAVDAGSGTPDAGPPPACPSNAVSLSTFGSAGAGSDDTAVFQNALTSTASAGQTLRVPLGQTSYQVRSLSVPSNANVCFESGVTVEASPGYGTNEVMWNINGVSNVQLLGYGATFHMNTSEWSSDPDPEYRHCVAIVGSSNVHAAGFTCVTFGGDGIYLAGNSANALVEDVTADGCARDGLTVISAKNSTVNRCHFINGHTGVDMEPNVPSDALDGVLLENSETDNNNYGGVNVSTYAYTSSSTPLNVTVRGHTDRNSANGATDFHAGSSYSANGTNGVAFSGTLLFDSCTSINAGSRAAWVAWWTSNGPNVTFQNLSVINPNQNGTAVDNAAVAVGRGGGGVGDQGNAYFFGTSVTDTQGKIDYYFTFYDGSSLPFSNVKFMDSGTLSGANKAPPNGLFNGTGVNTVDQ